MTKDFTHQVSKSGEWQHSQRQLRLRFYLVSWALFLLFSPVHLFPSGYPQPADGLMVLLIALLATGYVLPLPILNDMYLVALTFLGYCSFVNLFWWVNYSDPKLILASLYYPYNFAIFLLVISMMRQYRTDLVRVTRIALVAAILMEILFSLLGLVAGTGRLRGVGTFNNPNQLAYWSLLVACCYVTLKGDKRLTLFDLGTLAGVGYLVAVSASRAGLIGFVALALLAIFLQRLERAAKVGIIVLVLGGAVVMPIWATWDPPRAEREGEQISIWDRMTEFGGRPHDSLAGRGYDRFWLYPEHLLLGAGEGAYDRFMQSKVGDLEIHSSFGTLLFSYGIIGFVLFICLLYMIFRRAPLKHLAYAAPIALYSLTHQGLRDSLLWVFLALVLGMAQFGGSRLPRPASKRDASHRAGDAMPLLAERKARRGATPAA